MADIVRFGEFHQAAAVIGGDERVEALRVWDADDLQAVDVIKRAENFAAVEGVESGEIGASFGLDEELVGAMFGGSKGDGTKEKNACETDTSEKALHH